MVRDPRRAGMLMWAYFLLSVVVGPVIYIGVHRAAIGPAVGDAPGWVLLAFFSWRVTRGGRFSRMLLIIVSWIAFVLVAALTAQHFRLVTFGVLAVFAVQLGLLLSPAVYLRTRTPGRAEPAASRRVRPPLTLLLLSVLAGLIATLCGLANVGFPLAVPSCDVGGGSAVLCYTVAEGGPLHWLTVFHGSPVVNWGAMVKDWVQFALISVGVLYALWLNTRARERPVDAADVRYLTAVVGCVLGGLMLTVLTTGIPWSWLGASQYVPQLSGLALLADTVIWTLAGLCGCLAVYLAVPSRPLRTKAVS